MEEIIMANTYVDVNKEKYLKALFRDVQKQAKMIDFNNESKNAKLIHDFVIGNPTNNDKLDKYGMLKKNGLFIIKSRKSYKK